MAALSYVRLLTLGRQPFRENFISVLHLFCCCRLFLFTSLHAQKELLQGRLPDGFTEGLIEQVRGSRGFV
jgi:hypothetical protein